MDSDRPITSFASGHIRAQLVTLLLLMNIGLGLIAVASDVAQSGLISNMLAGQDISLAVAEASDSRQQTIGVAQLLLFLVTAIFFLVWIYRAHTNLPALGARGLKYSPGWAVAGFFVPILNLVRPYQVVKEIWKASDPNVSAFDASAWQRAPASPVIGRWWVSCLVFAASFVSWFSFRISSAAATLDDLLAGSSAILVADVLRVIAALFAIRVVRGIDARQEEKSRYRATPVARPTAAIEMEQPLTETAEVYLEHGLSYAATGDYDRAIADYDQAIRLDPQLAAAYYNRAAAYQDKGDMDRAIADYSEAITLDPGLVEAYYNRGVVYGGAGEHERAIVDFDRVIAFNPQDADAHYNRAIAYANKGDYRRAIADFDQAIAIEPLFADVYVLRARAHDRIGQPEKAVADLDKALELGLEPSLKQEAESLLERLKH